MLDALRTAAPLLSHAGSARLSRRDFVTTASTVATASVIGVPGWRRSTSAQDAAGSIITSRSRADVGREISEAFSLQTVGAPEGGTVLIGSLGDIDSFNSTLR